MISLFEQLKKKENELKSITKISNDFTIVDNDRNVNRNVQDNSIVQDIEDIEDKKYNDLSLIDSFNTSSKTNNNIINSSSQEMKEIKDKEKEELKIYDDSSKQCMIDNSIDNIQYSKQNLILKQQQYNNNNNNKSKDKKKQRIEFTLFDTKLPKLIIVKLDDLIWTKYPTERINIFGNTLFCGRIIHPIEFERIEYILPPYPTEKDNFEIVEIFCGLNRYERYHII